MVNSLFAADCPAKRNFYVANKPAKDGRMKVRLIEKTTGRVLLPLEEVFDEIERFILL